MSQSLLAPLQTVFRWMDDHPAVRLVLALALLAVAILMPLPAWLLDAWVGWTLVSALGVALLFLLAGSELPPGEVLASLPAFLNRAGLHHLALSAALTRAILLEKSPGAIVEWLAHHGFARHVGLGLAAFGLLYAARWGLAHFHASERLRWLNELAPAEREREARLVAEGRLSREAAERERAQRDHESQLLIEAAQAFKLLGRQAGIGFALTVCLVGAGLVTGLVLKGWPLQAALMHFTIYGLAEGFVAALPGLLTAFALAQWLRMAKEDAHADEEPIEAPEPPPLALEVGRELHAPIKRSFPATIAMVRVRLMQDLGLPLPRLALMVNAALPPGAYRLAVRGWPVHHGDLGDQEPIEAIAAELERAIVRHASGCLTLEATRAMLDELARRHPVLVAEASDRFGLPAVHGMLKGLLREQLPIRDLAVLLEGLLVTAPAGAPVPQLIEEARRVLAPVIAARLADESGTIAALGLDGAWNDRLAALTAWDATDRSIGQELVRAVAEARLRQRAHQAPTALVVPRRYRLLVAELLAALPHVAVVAPEELSPAYTLRLVGLIKLPASAPVT